MRLDEAGYRIATFAGISPAVAADAYGDPGVLVVDLESIPSSGTAALSMLRTRWPGVPILLIGTRSRLDRCEIPADLHPCIVRREPVTLSDLRFTIERAAADSRNRRESESLRNAVRREYSFGNFVGRKGTIENVIEAAAVASRKDLNVLIRGECGTGRRLLAKAIHFSGLRSKGPFVSVYCRALSPDAIESELFGKRHLNRSEAASGGTLYLHDIGRLSLAAQEKLLRLVERSTSGAGGHPSDLRLVASATRNMVAMLEEGSLREDLYYRCKFVTLELPPLRDRLEDLPSLVKRFLQQSRDKHRKPAVYVPDAVLDRFYRYGWPGNLAELHSVVDTAVAFSRKEAMEVADLPEALQVEEFIAAGVKLSFPYRGFGIDALEKQLIAAALERHNWNQTLAAKALGLTRKTLLYRIEKHAVQSPGLERRRKSGTHVQRRVV